MGDKHKKGKCIVCGCDTSRKRETRCQSCAGKQKTFTESHKANIKMGLTGKHPSDTTRLKISLSNMGKPKSTETRLKLSESHKGDKSWNWKGGVSSLNRQIRNCNQYKDWYKSVFVRDNYTCQFTGQRGNIVAHHIIPLATLMDAYKLKTIEDAINCPALWCIDNGITIAKKVHKEMHRGEKCQNLIRC